MPIPEQDLAVARELYEQNVLMEDIAKCVGWDAGYIRRSLIAAGVPLRQKPKQRQPKKQHVVRRSIVFR